MTLKDDNLQFVLMKTLADMVKGETDEARKELMTKLLTQYEETGTKSFSVQIPGAEKVATFTLAEPKPDVKVSDEFLEWCRANRPDLTETIEHPPVEGWTETRLSKDAIAAATAEAKLAGTSFITPDGEPIEGLEYVPAAAPKSFSVRYEKGGQERVIEAWRGGELAGIEPGATLPRIDAA